MSHHLRVRFFVVSRKSHSQVSAAQVRTRSMAGEVSKSTVDLITGASGDRRSSAAASTPRLLTVFAKSRQSAPPLRSNMCGAAAVEAVVTIKKVLTGYHAGGVTFNSRLGGACREPSSGSLIDLIDEAFDKRAWHGPTLRRAIAGVTPAQATWRPAPGRHNILELTLHAAYWKHEVRRRLR